MVCLRTGCRVSAAGCSVSTRPQPPHASPAGCPAGQRLARSQEGLACRLWGSLRLPPPNNSPSAPLRGVYDAKGWRGGCHKGARRQGRGRRQGGWRGAGGRASLLCFMKGLSSFDRLCSTQETSRASAHAWSSVQPSSAPNPWSALALHPESAQPGPASKRLSAVCRIASQARMRYCTPPETAAVPPRHVPPHPHRHPIILARNAPAMPAMPSADGHRKPSEGGKVGDGCGGRALAVPWACPGRASPEAPRPLGSRRPLCCMG